MQLSSVNKKNADAKRRTLEKRMKKILAATTKHTSESVSNYNKLKEVFASMEAKRGTADESLRKIAERYAEIANAMHGLRKNHYKLAELAEQLDTPTLHGLEDRDSSEYFRNHSTIFELISKMYDHSIDIEVHRPSSGIRGVFEDSENIESYFSNALKETANFGKK